MVPSRRLAIAIALFLALPALHIPSRAQDEAPPEQPAEQAQPEQPPQDQQPPDQTQGQDNSGDNSAPVVENPPAEGQPQPDGAEPQKSGGEEVSGGGEVIAGGDMPVETGPDNGGLVEGSGTAKVKKGRKAKPKVKGKRGAKKRRNRGTAALEAASSISPLIPAAKLPTEVVKPVEPLPVIALSPIAPYNP